MSMRLQRLQRVRGISTSQVGSNVTRYEFNPMSVLNPALIAINRELGISGDSQTPMAVVTLGLRVVGIMCIKYYTHLKRLSEV